jgi:hypothetical protein
MKVKSSILLIVSALVAFTGCLPLPSIDRENAAEDPEHLDYLIAYYPFDGSADDMGTNGYNGVPINDPSYVDDTPSGSGKALRLNGFKKQYINIPYSYMNGLIEYSVSFWIKDFGMGMVFSAISSDYVRSDYPRLLITDTQKFRFYTGYDNYDQTLSFGYDCTSIMASEWHHVVLVVYYQDTKIIRELYVDGVLIDANEGYWDKGVATKMTIGGDKNESYPMSISAKFDNFRFYGCALSHKDVLYLYNNNL